MLRSILLTFLFLANVSSAWPPVAHDVRGCAGRTSDLDPAAHQTPWFPAKFERQIAQLEKHLGAVRYANLGHGGAGVVAVFRKADGGFVTAKVGEKDLQREYENHRDLLRRAEEQGVALKAPKLGPFVREANAFILDPITTHDHTGRNPFVSARSLKQLLAAKPAVFGPGNEAFVDIVAKKLREAVADVHKLGYVHRDIKPGNVLVTMTADGEIHVWLVDFGIALPKGVVPVSAYEGSPSYASVGQLRGDAAEFSHDDVAVERVIKELREGAVTALP